ncbi:MAG: polysaccharide deacetylase family protein [Bacilli bacterium]|nr:polysaccharide deacetylase family protein [Bacilli bacterium]
MKKNVKKIMRLILFFFLLVFIFFLINNYIKKEADDLFMVDLTNYSLSEVKNYAKRYELKLKINYTYSKIDKDKIISQNIKPKAKFARGDYLEVTVVKEIDDKLWAKYQVNELGMVPIMMYHGIFNLNNSDVVYTGGNVDSDGYNRTTEAFINDLEMFYQNDYRMIRLNDYINSEIDVPLGTSPIILTFDDGARNNINVLGYDKKGNLIIDPNSAVGILEHFKKKYPDFQVTATFFLNAGLFNQPQYNEDILKWLIKNGYDIGNHTKNHDNLSKMTKDEVMMSIGYMYQLFEEIIPNQYVNIISLPFGLPDSKNHQHFPYILGGTYHNTEYQNLTALRVGWDADYSPYHQAFDCTYLKRIRAWDNNGVDFDIEMVFNNLKQTRYISSGLKDVIVIPKEKSPNLASDLNMEVIEY